MNAVVDRILATYTLIRPLCPEQIGVSRQRISGYLEKLSAAGKTDKDELAVFGLAYLKELHEGPNPRFTGC